MRSKGKVIDWNDEKGFGFIEPFGASKKHFFIHRTDIKRLNRAPIVGDIITFSIGKDKAGRVRAENAVILAAQKRHTKNTIKEYNVLLAVIFLIIVLFCYFFGKIPFEVFGLYIVASLVAYLMYFMDKRAAKRRSDRVSEQTLLIIGIIGGWPGAIIGQQLHRHKSKKVSFRRAFWFTVLINIAAFICLLYALGHDLITIDFL